MRLMTLFVLALTLAAAQTLQMPSDITVGGKPLTMTTPWIEKTQTAERTVEIPGHYYVVRYEYGTGMVTAPAIMGAKAHYSASIEVFEVIDGSKRQIGKAFPGQYVDGGCFEDKPETLIKEALKSVDRLTPEIEAAFDERDQKAAFEAMPVFSLGSDNVLTITKKGERDIKAIVVDGKAIWGTIPDPPAGPWIILRSEP